MCKLLEQQEVSWHFSCYVEPASKQSSHSSTHLPIYPTIQLPFQQILSKHAGPFIV